MNPPTNAEPFNAQARHCRGHQILGEAVVKVRHSPEIGVVKLKGRAICS
jgi:hypothetical protein